jgi:hypothetical protein
MTGSTATQSTVPHSSPVVGLEWGSLPAQPQTPCEKSATEELSGLLDHKKLYRRGIGVTDLQLICCDIFDRSVLLWTRDRRLREIAEESGIHV